MLSLPPFESKSVFLWGFKVRATLLIWVHGAAVDFQGWASQSIQLSVLWVFEIWVGVNALGNLVDSVNSVIYGIPHLSCELVIRIHLFLIIFPLDLLQILISYFLTPFRVSRRVNVLNFGTFKIIPRVPIFLNRSCLDNSIRLISLYLIKTERYLAVLFSKYRVRGQLWLVKIVFLLIIQISKFFRWHNERVIIIINDLISVNLREI